MKRQVLFLSRIHVKKGIELLIDAWKNLIDSFPGWRIKIVCNGEEEYIASLKSKIIELGLQESIDVLPPVYGQEKVDLYQSSALFVLPSYSENFGIVVPEALASGTPVITTIGTPWEELNSEHCGWCTEIGTGGLTKALKEFVQCSDSDLEAMGRRGRKLVEDKYASEAVSKMFEKMYSSL